MSILLCQNDITWFQIAGLLLSPVIALSLAGWAEWCFWPKFKKQERTKNLSINAKEALRTLSRIECETKRLIVIVKKFGGKDEVFLKGKLDLLDRLQDLQDILLLVSKDSDLIPNKEIDEAKKLIEQLGNTLSHKYPMSPEAFAVIDFLGELGINLNEDKPNLDRLRTIRELLLKIYEIH